MIQIPNLHLHSLESARKKSATKQLMGCKKGKARSAMQIVFQANYNTFTKQDLQITCNLQHNYKPSWPVGMKCVCTTTSYLQVADGTSRADLTFPPPPVPHPTMQTRSATCKFLRQVGICTGRSRNLATQARQRNGEVATWQHRRSGKTARSQLGNTSTPEKR